MGNALEQWLQGGASWSFEPGWRHFSNIFSAVIFISVLLGLMDFSDIVMLHSGRNSCCQQNLKCFDMPLLSLGLFSWKRGNDCQTNLSMFFEPRPGLCPQCPICADMLLSIACQRTQESGWKKQKRTKNYADKVIIRFYSVTYCCFKTSPSFPKHPSKYFLRSIWQSILSMPAHFHRIIHQQAQVLSFETWW